MVGVLAWALDARAPSAHVRRGCRTAWGREPEPECVPVGVCAAVQSLSLGSREWAGAHSGEATEA